MLQGLYQKANALYQMGDFEYALVYYHRGSKLRPDLTECTQGIHKAQEAINNSIGSKLAGVNIYGNHNFFIFSTRIGVIWRKLEISPGSSSKVIW